MSPASGIEPGDAWTLRVYVVNEGKKPIRVQGLTVATTVNGAGSGGPVSPRAREIAPQQRVTRGRGERRVARGHELVVDRGHRHRRQGRRAPQHDHLAVGRSPVAATGRS